MEPVLRPSIPSIKAMSCDTPFSKSLKKSMLLKMAVSMASEAKWSWSWWRNEHYWAKTKEHRSNLDFGRLNKYTGRKRRLQEDRGLDIASGLVLRGTDVRLRDGDDVDLYTCVYTYLCIHTYHINSYIYIYIYTHICIYIYSDAYMEHVCICIICMYVCMYVYIYIYIHTFIELFIPSGKCRVEDGLPRLCAFAERPLQLCLVLVYYS